MNKLNKNSDFYSSTEYVKHISISNLQNAISMTKSFPPSLFNSLETLNYSSNFKENSFIKNNISIQRLRTKSLDNGNCFSLGSNKNKQINNSTNILNERKKEENNKINNYSRLEKTKQFFKRFYNSTN
ncbi:hypothetical protein ACQ4LE_001571, partial [Meloidogyne hapla]